MIGAEGALVLKKPGLWPVSSPDGRWIAFTDSNIGSERTAILTMPRIGGPERRIAEVGTVTYPDRFVSWTPDSKWLASQDRDDPNEPFHIVLVSAETGEKHRLTSPPSGILGDSGPAVSPDGKTLAFTRHTFWGASDLYLSSLDAEYRTAGEPRRLTTDVANANSAVWTPDGREVVFCSRVWHAATLWRVRADGSAPPRALVLGGRGAYVPDISPTGNRLVYAKHVWDTNVWRIELLPSGLPAGAPQSFIQSNLVDTAGTFSPDGGRVAFVSERSGLPQLWVADARGAEPRPLTSMESNRGMEPEWSPDGESIAFRADVSGNPAIYVVGVRGGAPRRLTSDPAARDQAPRWSRDGQWIYFESERGGRSQVWRVARDGGEATLADPQRIGREDADGASRYFVKEAKAGLSIWRQPTGGGAENLVADAVASGDFALTRRGIYFSASGPEGSYWGAASIVFREFASGKTTKVVDLKLGTLSGRGLSVSPDGRYLLYTQCDQETGDLMLVENFR
jgi:Tol biopolymer transport system component